jgi:parallel beta-helix repeat protein
MRHRSWMIPCGLLTLGAVFGPFGCGSGSGNGSAPIADATGDDDAAMPGTVADASAEGASSADSGTGDDGTSDGSDSSLVDAVASGGADTGADVVDDGCGSGVALYVAAATGLDTNAGTLVDAPLKTLTHAIALADASSCITTINVAAGTYDAANGEVFPLVPRHVAIIGDEANKGNAGAGAVLVSGGGLLTMNYWPTFAPGPNATIAGLKISAPHVTLDSGAAYGLGFYLAQANGIERNNTVTQCDYIGIEIESGATGSLIGNDITANGTGGPSKGAGIDIENGTVKAEGNVVTGNPAGMAVGSATCDFGGGALGSIGGNVFSCNTSEDLFLESANFEVQNDFWDHMPPTSTGASPDIVLHSVSAGAITTNAALATNRCP